jgi:hypothetical protein
MDANILETGGAGADDGIPLERTGALIVGVGFPSDSATDRVSERRSSSSGMSIDLKY